VSVREVVSFAKEVADRGAAQAAIYYMTTPAVRHFVFTKPGVEAGESLADILIRKEAERIAGKNTFWWGVGNSVGVALEKAAQDSGGTLPILFLVHKTQTPPKKRDASPQRVVVWTKWQDRSGSIHHVPTFANITSRWDETKRTHYALVCYSEKPMSFDPNGPAFDPSLCRTALGKVPGSSQVTALVSGNLNASEHQNGKYRVVFHGTLVRPWQARLVEFR
jgi:hypothetical protein